MDDTQQELQRLEQELLDESLQQPIRDKKPAFEDPEKLRVPETDMVYHNFSNNYGKETEEGKKAAYAAAKKKNEQIILGLMIAASVLCVGIIGVLIYWLEVFFR